MIDSMTLQNGIPHYSCDNGFENRMPSGVSEFAAHLDQFATQRLD
jgi:hypothetical protein